PARNVATTLDAQLTALLAQRGAPRFEVIVVDNGSDDDTVGVAQRRFDGTDFGRIVDQPLPGINAARNAGVRASRGRNVLLCDGDDLVDARWVREMHAALGRVDLVGGALDLETLNARSVRAGWGMPQHLLPSQPQYGFLPAPYGANCGFRREVWDVIGGFDESLRMGGDDFDFFWRAQLAGKRLTWAPEAVVAYRLRPGVRDTWRRQFRFGRANVQMYDRFRSRGLDRTPVGIALRAWAWHFTTGLATLRTREGRTQWVAGLAKRTGRLYESARSRRCYL
ncbi:MAG: glycosyltransferase, partial [Pirellulales bacterium]|nr:glycosyltransferase [Pirellulales bacterium]